MDFEEIYELYFRDVVLYLRSRFGNETIAEEVAQETFFKALKAIDRFDGSKDILAWLFTIAKNTYLSNFRKQKRSVQLDVETFENVPDSTVTLLEELSNEEDAFIIHQFIHTMAEPYKEVFTLRVFGELPFEKIGKLFGKSAGWARVTYHRARKQVMEYMEAMNDENDQL